ncbi:MAG: malectin domain-containing carbohydrate-binding protein, partial [Chitinophagaceae bacterium]
PGYNYIYRINCGGGEYKDESGSVWLADKAVGSGKLAVSKKQSAVGSRKSATQNLYWSSFSWTDKFPGMSAFFGSQRRTFDPIKGTKDWQLFQDFRYGKDQLKYEFPLPDGEYIVELYFVEPWLGIGGGMDATHMRLFDVAINNKIVLHDLDIWKEVGTNTALKKIVRATVTGGKMVISFPNSPAGEAIISAIAIASVNKNIHAARTPSLVKKFAGGQLLHWMDIGNHQYSDTSFAIHSLPPVLYGADWMQFSRKPGNPIAFQLADKADVFIAIDKNSINKPAWLKGYEDTQTEMETDENAGKKYEVFRKRFPKDAIINIEHSRVVGAIMILPVTNMQPAYDLKPVNSYKTNVASISSGIKKETVGGRECVVVKSVGKTNVQWPIQTGVADIYSVTIKYYYPGETKRTGKVQLVNTGGTMMLSEPVTFTFTRPGKWNTVTFNTSNMVNAGNYIVKLELENAEGLTISGIDVQ